MIYLSRFVIGVLTLLPFVTIAAASPSYIETATTTLAAGRMQQDNLTDHKHLTICPLNRYQAATQDNKNRVGYNIADHVCVGTPCAGVPAPATSKFNYHTLNHNAIKYKASDYPVEMQYCEAIRVKQLQ